MCTLADYYWLLTSSGKVINVAHHQDQYYIYTYDNGELSHMYISSSQKILNQFSEKTVQYAKVQLPAVDNEDPDKVYDMCADALWFGRQRDTRRAS